MGLETEMNMKRIIAKESLSLTLVALMAWLISNINFYQQLIYNTGLCGINNIEGLKIDKMAGDNFDLTVRLRTEVVEHRIFVYGFILIVLSYFFIRFIIWAFRELKQKK